MSANKYTGLLAGHHARQPKYTEMVYQTTQPFADLATAAEQLPLEFDLDKAEGVQLDAVGIRVGIGRRVASPLEGVYFALDMDGVGFDQGVWKGEYDPNSGVTVLDDDTYRMIIQAKIAANAWDGTNESIQQILEVIFTNGMHAIVEDNQDMSMTVCIVGQAPSAILLELLKRGYLSVKPAGVHIAYYITATSDAPLFGFDVQNDFIAGFDTGAFGALSRGA